MAESHVRTCTHNRIRAEMYYDSDDGTMMFRAYIVVGTTENQIAVGAEGAMTATIGPADDQAGDIDRMRGTGSYIARFRSGNALVTYLSRNKGSTWSLI